MKNNVKNRLVIISAPSGAGKSTIIAELLKRNSNIRFSVSYTTRSPRKGEKDGVDYHYISEEKFKSKIKNGDFLEWAKVHTNYYGTGRKEIEEGLKEGNNILLDIDVQGALQIMKDELKPVSVFILPPSKKELIRRLEKRADLNPEDLKIRVRNAALEIRQAEKYDYAIVNEEIEDTVKKIEKIILSEKPNIVYNDRLIKDILKTFEE